jgi:hypothetical protein
MMAGMITLILTGRLRGVRTQRSLVLENLALRHQLAVMQRSAPRPRLRTADRLLWALLSRLWNGWTDVVSIVQPATVIRWQRTGFKLFWTWKSRRSGPEGTASTFRHVGIYVLRRFEPRLPSAGFRMASGGRQRYHRPVVE